MNHRLLYWLCLGVCVSLSSQGCSSDDTSGSGDGGAGGLGDGDGDGDGDAGTTLDITASGDGDGDGSGDGDGGAGGGGPVCETASAAADLPPVYLAFAFDVSGSMGFLTPPAWWNDVEAKWQPVVEATTAFFTDSSSQGISASMALFPAAENRCEAENYETPEVAITSLPSNAFSDAFADYEEEVGDPLATGDWRGGTPTAAALTGVGASLDSLRQDTVEEAEFAIVLVTDGLPEGCSADISSALGVAEDLYADGLPTYVIGIENPTTPPDELPEDWEDWGECAFGPGGGDTPCMAPDTLDALNELASVGGTEEAFLIDTGDPSATERAFRAAIEAIREGSMACTVAIPENPDEDTSFDPDKVDVTVTVDGAKMRLNYDPECSESDSWHYDDEDDPEAILLCESTCSEVQANPDAELTVEFLCEPREDIIR